MKQQLVFTTLIAIFAASFAGCDRDDKEEQQDDNITIIRASGDINASLNQFRQLLGAPVNTTPGATGGRREINWDGVPDSLMGKALPTNFFNPPGTDPALAPLQRGLTYAPTPAPNGFRVSNVQFSDVNPQAA